jgi:hypothetical protein
MVLGWFVTTRSSEGMVQEKPVVCTGGTGADGLGDAASVAASEKAVSIVVILPYTHHFREAGIMRFINWSNSETVNAVSPRSITMPI